jgi:CubicO group peptidase (beta-lactamase class C family)
VDQPWGHGRWRLFGVLPLYGLGWKPFDPGSANADFPRAGAPAGMVHLSAPDWARFVALHLRGDHANPHRDARLLEAGTFAVLHGTGASAGYHGGWYVDSRPWARGNRPGDTGRVLFHAGDNGRWTCVAWLAPEIDLAILVACNRGGMHRPVDAIAAALVGRFAGPAEHWR